MIERLIGSFVNGLAVPLTAACVLPLYPGFLSYLSKQFDGEVDRRNYILSGILVFLGVFSFMFLLGLVFSAFLGTSLTSVIQVVSPLAFGILAIFSILLLLDLDFGEYLSRINAPRSENPMINAFGFGFFFGAIVIPCNPGFIAVFFARASLFSSPLTSIINFSAFGLGIGFPLLMFSVLSSAWSETVIGFLKRNESRINRITGAIMLLISLYYLTCVFGLGGVPGDYLCSGFKLVISYLPI